METNYLKEAIDCLGEERRVLHYYKEKYAIDLLKNLMVGREKIKIDELRSSRFSKLLNKNLVKELLSQCGSSFLTRNKLEEFFSCDYESYVVTLSTWSNKKDYSWTQTSRPGVNLVLQLNFTGEHDQLMAAMKVDGETFKYYSHPIHDSKCSMAWARLDFDLEAGEVLIEEIQNDWLRKARRHYLKSKFTALSGRTHYYFARQKYNAQDMLVYTECILKRYDKIWSETLMAITIDFIKRELGINKVFYHSFDTGRVLKNLGESSPPKSLYTDLPKKFCFSEVDEGPSFIMANKFAKRRLKKVAKPSWFYLAL